MKFVYTVLFAVLSSTALAQSNYHEGYIVKNNGDTLKGYIDYREWEKNPKSINFRVAKEDRQTKQFDAATIRGFGINGMETYTSYTGLISNDRDHFPDLSTGLDTSKKLDTIFLKQLVTGKYLTLYYHNDDIKMRYFIAEANGKPVELQYHEYYRDAEETATSAIYKGQLLLYINKFDPGNSKLISKVAQVQYEQSSLGALVDRINNNGTAIKKKSSNRFFAGLSINRTNTEVNEVYGSGTQNDITILPKINFGVDVFNNPNVQRLILRLELSLSYINPQFKYPETVGITTANQVYEFNQYTASLTPQILVNVYNKDNFKVYIDAGIAFNFSAYSNNKFSIVSTNDNAITPYTIEKPYKLEPSWADFPLQAGVTLNKKIELSVTYTGFAAYTKYNPFYASNQSTAIGIKYFLGRH
jgi:hypothetical protein